MRLIHLSALSADLTSRASSSNPNPMRRRSGNIRAVSARYHRGGRNHGRAPPRMCAAISRAAGLTVSVSDCAIAAV